MRKGAARAGLLKGPVVIVAGYCGEEAHKAALIEAFRGFKGTILSGGTKASVSAVVGELQAAYPGRLHTVGYVPRELPGDVELDRRYGEHRCSPGADFSPMEPLQYWADLLVAKVPTDQIRLIAIGGGQITADECQMALALGVPVAIVETGGSKVRPLLNELGWLGHPLHHGLSMDVADLRGFLLG